MKKEESFKAYQMVSMYLMALMGIERAFSTTKLSKVLSHDIKELTKVSDDLEEAFAVTDIESEFKSFNRKNPIRIDMRELKEKMAAGYGVDLDKLEGVVR